MNIFIPLFSLILILFISDPNLRAGNRNKKKRKDKIDDLIVPEEDIVKSNTSVRNKDANVPIYDDIDDYKHKTESKDSRRERRDDRRDKERGRDRDGDRKRQRQVG